MAQQTAIEAPAEELEDLVDELQPGTKLLKGQYTITRFLNSGGFGITYLAKDSLDRDVVIKECFPSSFCRRSQTMVTARSRAHSAELRSVVQLFVREARNLAKIVHPNIVAVHQVFEDNGTAYMAIDYVDGLDLQQIIDGQGTMPGPDGIVRITEKLLEAVGFIHANDMLHRDISPDNVLIDRAGEPILIDFGAAREQASQKSRAMSALRVVKDGYSPQEFYIAGSEQGPWSDLYALGATLYHLISGQAPVNGQARLAALAEDRPDPYLPLEGRFPGYPPGFLRAIDTALNTLPKQRLQSAQEWLSFFKSGPAAARTLRPVDPVAAAVHQMVQSSLRDPAKAADAPATASPAADKPTPTAPEATPPLTAAQTQPQAEATSEKGGGVGLVQVAAGIVVVLALVGGGMVLLRGTEAPPASEPTLASATPTAPAPAASAPPESAPAAAPAPATEGKPIPEVAPVSDETAAAAAPETPKAEDPVATAQTLVPAAPVAVTGTDLAVEAQQAAPEPTTAAPEPTAAAPERADAAPEPAVPTTELLENQISFAAWDVEMPFIEGNRLVANRRVAVIERLLPTADLAETGTWLAPGLVIHSVNGTDVQQSGSIAAAILNALNVDPDGRARVVVEYSLASGQDRQTGLLTVKAKRIVSLANGLTVSIASTDGEWRTVVDSVPQASPAALQPGDVLFRDKTTGTALDGPQSLETIMNDLVGLGARETEFSIIRNNRVTVAAMQLVAR
ncbi:serine/threonine-protein kinase [Tabrizicola sp. YIM 78059]|uniref:serine/threonine-protein kinase n=1 Tax=Tabrizicola sp. YIM 78059 TaxID=2529861 RepID=UPI0010AB2FB7|nr:serine/threonine-protein kinase [Tabrizicola sp. YIM 78059]